MKMILISSFSALILVSCQTPAPPPVSPEPIPKITNASEPKPEPKTTTPFPERTPPKIEPYPLKNCLVTDEPLNTWDDMQTIVYKGQEMKFCCEMCLKKFNKDPEKYLSLLP
ncbi:MAG: YHS domain-containing protein [Akkermansiaceae bacterium]